MTPHLIQLVKLEYGEAKTTSFMISEGTGVEHKAVIQLVRNYLGDLEEFGRVTFEVEPFETNGGIQRREVAHLNERHATLVLTYMKNSEVVRNFKKRLVKAFYELSHVPPALKPEIQIAHAMLLAGRLIEEQKEQIAQRDKLIAVVQPKAAALDRLSVADGSLCITNAAKTLQVQPKFLFNLLSKEKFIYRRPGCGNWIAYQDKLQTGYLEHKVTTIERTGNDPKTVEQVLVTPKGLVKLASMIGHS